MRACRPHPSVRSPIALVLIALVAGILLGAPAPAVRAAGAAAREKPGEVIEKFDDGKVHIRYRNDTQGHKNGLYEELFPNGKIQVRGSYTAGEKTGLWRTYDESGKVIESATYHKGILEGPYQWTAPGGKAGFSVSYRNGAYAGPVTVFDERGRLSKQVEYPHPMSDIRKAWDMFYPKENHAPTFTEEPVLSSPYKAGTISPQSLEEALKLVKLYRYLSGAPWQQLALDPTANDKAQHGAVLLHQIGSLTHTPAKPADMDDAFFKLAYAGCNQSNIYQGGKSLFDAIRGFMDDSDKSNVEQIGHRRWILSPGLQKTGFGNAENFSVMHVIDGSRGAPNFDFIAFPGPGFYPLQLVEPHHAWSVHFNAAKAQVPAAEALKVTVTRLDEHYQPGKAIDAKVINVVRDAMQGWNVVVFKPELSSLDAGKYWVEVTGLKTPRGPAPAFGYIVDLVDMTATAEAGPATAAVKE